MKRLMLAAACLVVAAFLKFALIGYGFMAMCFVGLAAVLALYELCVRKRWKGWRRVLSAALILGFAFFIACEMPVLLASRGDDLTEPDYLIVLGAGVNGTVPSLSMRNRLDAALEVMNESPDCIAIVSGGQGQGEDITEAEAMYRWLTDKGIEKERLWKEERSTSTEENLAFSLAMIDDAETADIAVVSSEYHLYRAKLLAKENHGLDVFGVAGKTSYPVLKVNYFIREAFAVAYLWVFGM